MENTEILYIAACAVFFALIAKYDIHMFQLSSYRPDRYRRWLFSGNVASLKRLFSLLMLAGAFIPGYWGCGFAAGVATASIAHACGEKFKTPPVYTMRVKRLLLTDSLLFMAIVACTILFAPRYADIAAGAALVLSNVIMLLANLLNAPMEKAINRHYLNDAKRIISSNKGLIVIGVTGSFGKTSTKNYLAGLLAEKYNVLVTPGNFNTLLGVVRTIREQLRPHHQVFIVEMGAKQSGDIKEICDLVHPSIGIVTAVGEMHLETFGCIENIQKTKFELINALPDDGLGVINIDSDAVREFKGIASRCKMLTYAVEHDADCRACDVEYTGGGVSFTLSTNNERFESRLLGAGNLLDMLAAICVAARLDVPVQKQKNAIARLRPVEHRLSVRNTGGITVLDDAYNSNPTGAALALDVLRNFKLTGNAKRIIITPGFVEMGTRQYDANKELGRGIARSCDYAIVVNTTNREAITSGIREGGFDESRLFAADSLNQAHAHLATILQAGDVVLYENDLPDNFK